MRPAPEGSRARSNAFEQAPFAFNPFAPPVPVIVPASAEPVPAPAAAATKAKAIASSEAAIASSAAAGPTLSIAPSPAPAAAPAPLSRPNPYATKKQRIAAQVKKLDGVRYPRVEALMKAAPVNADGSRGEFVDVLKARLGNKVYFAVPERSPVQLSFTSDGTLGRGFHALVTVVVDGVEIASRVHVPGKLDTCLTEANFRYLSDGGSTVGVIQFLYYIGVYDPERRDPPGAENDMDVDGGGSEAPLYVVPRPFAVHTANYCTPQAIASLALRSVIN